MNFDFTKILKRGGGRIITTPTIHICKNGEFSFYCVEAKNKEYFRAAIDGSKVGIEFSLKPYGNSFSIREKRSTLSSNAKSVVRAVPLTKYIGTDYYSANFALHQENDNLYWFDLAEPIVKYKRKK
ncbi:hypothetical protein [Lactococcus lactis]